MHRFFVAPELLAPPTATIMLPEKQSHQVRDVLRLAIDEQLVLLDNSGDEWLCAVTRSNRAGVEVTILERRPGKSESPVRVILCQGLLKSARFEWILEKGTELGVASFVPLLCRRSMSGLEEAGPSKIQRWQRIIQEAAEQCGRARLPELLPSRPLMHALNDIPSDAIALMPWEEERATSLRAALQAASKPFVSDGLSEARHFCSEGLSAASRASGVDPRNSKPAKSPITVVLFIGPEGGLTGEEVALARRHSVQPVTLGPRILRAETAALAAIANIMHELE